MLDNAYWMNDIAYENYRQYEGPDGGGEPVADEDDEEVLHGEGPCLLDETHGEPSNAAAERQGLGDIENHQVG